MELAHYRVNAITGFLPVEDPLQKLPPEFAAWEQVAGDLSVLLMTGRLRGALESLPILEANDLQTLPELNRAMLLLSILGNAYVWGGESAALKIPRGIAIPLWQVAERLGIPPITAHTHIVLHNWRRLDPDQPISLENIAPLQLFLGGLDEAWFYMVTVAIEAEGGRVVQALLDAQVAALNLDEEGAFFALQKLESSLTNMLATLNRMPEKCAPYVFYHRIRPYIASWPEPGVVYEGVSETPYKLIGGSAAQSPLIQALDAGLDILHESDQTSRFLTEMRRYMLPVHCEFIDALRAGTSIRAFASEYAIVAEQYNICTKLLDTFRQKHLEIAVTYISHQAKADGKQAIGTGGTDFVPLLSEARKETRERVISESLS